MLNPKRRGFTLLELVLVVSMIVILAAIGTGSYTKSKHKAVSKEAIANLKLIAAAERIYKMESGSDTYLTCTDVSNCNSLLKLNLNATNWSQSVAAGTGTGVNATATITATGTSTGISGCTYTLTQGDFDTADYSSKTATVCP